VNFILIKRKLGADVSVDVSCEWLSFFLESDERLEEIFTNYASGAMLTGEVKKELIGLLTVRDNALFKMDLNGYFWWIHIIICSHFIQNCFICFRFHLFSFNFVI